MDSSVSVANAEQFEIAASSFQLDMKRGDLSDGFMTAFVDAYFGNSTDGFESFTVDLGTASALPITVSGYAAQTLNNFTFSTVAD